MSNRQSQTASDEVTLRDFHRAVVRAGFWRSERRFRTYLGYLFRDVPLQGGRFLDVGGGAGLFAAAARALGAAEAVCLEPGGAGASAFIKEVAAQGVPADAGWGIGYVASTLEEYHAAAAARGRFDTILLHNVINHLDEPACIRLHRDERARQLYMGKVQLLRDMAVPGARLIVCDCARNNFLPDLGMPNPLMRTIEWYKHQNPGVWRALFQQGGWRHLSTDWTTPNFLGRPGRLLGNRLAGYFLLGHFRMVFQRVE